MKETKEHKLNRINKSWSRGKATREEILWYIHNNGRKLMQDKPQKENIV